jgi:hypothetical protein
MPCLKLSISRVHADLVSQFGSFGDFQFVEDRTAPDRTVHALDGQGEQEVSLRTGPQHAGIEESGEHMSILPELSLSTPSLGSYTTRVT